MSRSILMLNRILDYEYIIRNLEIYKKIIKKYLNRYFKIYIKIHSNKCFPKTLIKLQKEINSYLNTFINILRDIKKIKNDNETRKYACDAFRKNITIILEDFEFLRQLYMSIIDDMIIKFICNNECGLFSKLSINCEKNNSYNYDNVNKYIERIKEEYNKRKAYYIVCDMSSINLDCGDIIFRNKKNVDYIEIKNHISKSGNRVLKAIKNNDKNILLNEYEKKEFVRIQKQLEKHKIIDGKFNSCCMINGRYPNNFIKIKGFIDIVKKDIKKIKHKLFIERNVDDCIKYIMINNKYNKFNNYDKIKLEQKLIEYVPNGEDCFSYEEFLFDSIVSRPYLLGWSLNEYKKIVKGEIEIFFKIDVIKIIDKYREKGIKVFCKKETDNIRKETGYLKYKGKSFYQVVGKNAIPICNMFIYRIPAMLYTSEKIVNYYYKIYQEVSDFMEMYKAKVEK